MKAKLTPQDRQRFHELLDYALDHDEDYVIMQFANMDLDYHLHRTFYRLKIDKENDVISKDKQNQE